MSTWVGISLRWPNLIYKGTANKIWNSISWFRILLLQNMNENLQVQIMIRHQVMCSSWKVVISCSWLHPVPCCHNLSSDALIEIYCKLWIKWIICLSVRPSIRPSFHPSVRPSVRGYHARPFFFKLNVQVANYANFEKSLKFKCSYFKGDITRAFELSLNTKILNLIMSSL